MKKYWRVLSKRKPLFPTKRYKIMLEMAEKTALEDLEDLLKHEDLLEPISFSSEFEENMDNLFEKYERKEKKKEKRKLRTSNPVYKAAMIAVYATLTVFIFVGITTEAIPYLKHSYTIRKDVGSYAYLLNQEESTKSTIYEKYEPTLVPRGYQLSETTDELLLYKKVYVNSENKHYYYSQLTKQVIIKVDELMKNYQEIIIDNSRYYTVERNNMKRIIWYANGYQYSMNIEMPINEVIKMARSIKKQ